MIVQASRPAGSSIPSARQMAAALAVSFGVPPPKLISASAPFSRAKAAAAMTLRRGTCCTVSGNTPAQRPPVAATTLSSRAPCRVSEWPVTTTARRTPCFSSSAESCARLPQPKWTSSIGSMVKCPRNSSLGKVSIGLLLRSGRAAGARAKEHRFGIRVKSARGAPPAGKGASDANSCIRHRDQCVFAHEDDHRHQRRAAGRDQGSCGGRAHDPEGDDRAGAPCVSGRSGARCRSRPVHPGVPRDFKASGPVWT